MFPFVPVLAWAGGIAASAQVAGGMVRGVGKLARGKPGAAMIEVADGLLSPFTEVYRQVIRLGGDVVDAVVGIAESPMPDMDLPAPPPPKSRGRRRRAAVIPMPSANGGQAS